MSNRKQSFDEILKEDFARAAEDIEREVEESGVEHMSDSLKQSIHAKLQEQIAAYENEKVYAQLTEEDRKALELGKEVMRQQEEKTAEKKVVHKKKRLRGYLIIAAALVLAMALGVTSMGGANRVISIVKSVVGDREVVKTNSNEDNLIIAKEKEEEAYQQITDAFGIEPVKIIIRPNGMKFKELILDEVLQTAEMFYEYEDQNVMFLINASYTDSSWGVDTEDKETDQYYFERQEAQIEVKEYLIRENNTRRYSAKFSYKGLEYYLVGTMKKAEFEKILKNLYFF